MFKFYTLIMLSIIVFDGFCKDRIIKIPDKALKLKLLTYVNIDTNNDLEISENEALQVKNLYLSCNSWYCDSLKYTDESIKSAEGLQFFRNLEELDVTSQSLQKLDLSSFKKLQRVWCGNNRLTELNVSGLTQLKVLECRLNKIQNLNTIDLISIQYLSCPYNEIPVLDLSNSHNLTDLICKENRINKLSFCQEKIKQLSISNNKIDTLNLDSCFNLEDLYCAGNPLQSLYIPSKKIKSIELKDMPNLQYICIDKDVYSDLQRSIYYYYYSNNKFEVKTDCSN